MCSVGKYLQKHGASSASEAQVEGRRKEENERGKQHLQWVFRTGTAVELEPTKFPRVLSSRVGQGGDLRTLFAPENPPSRERAEGLTIEIE